MVDTVVTILALILLFVGLPILILRFTDRRTTARRRRRHPSQIAEREAYERRILAPDWGYVERCLLRPSPQALRDLYADRRLVTERDLAYDDELLISTFVPLDEEALADTKRWLGFEAVAIATTDFGDTVYLRPGAAQGDAVYIAHHDGGDAEVMAESVTQMLATLRRRHPYRSKR